MQEIEWQNKILGRGFEIEPIKRGNKKARWAFCLTLPEKTDPATISINYVDSEYGPNRRHNDHFVVSYNILASPEPKIITVPLGFGDRRIDRNNFSVKISRGAENRTPTARPPA